MNKRIGIVFISIAALISCNPPPEDKGSNQTTQVYVITGSNGSPNGTDPGTCLPVDRVRIVEFPTNLTVNASARIDVTPRDAFGNTRSDQCNEKDGNRWDSNDDVCSIGQPNVFVTTIKGIKIGACTITACVASKCDTVTFPVS